MIGVILAGGRGTRYYPNTVITSKHLLPLYNKPIIYYSLALLMEANIRDIIMIVSECHYSQYSTLLGDGSRFGINIRYIIQERPLGTAHALQLAKEYINEQYCVLVYGDNYIYSSKVSNYLNDLSYKAGATIFGYKVDNPCEYGVIELSKDGKVLSLEEKPRFPKSNYAMIGLMCFDTSVCDKLNNVTLSIRNELEITDVLNAYLSTGQLHAIILEDDDEWSDLGNAESVTFWGNKIMQDEKTTGVLKGYVEEIALRKKWVSPVDLYPFIEKYQKSQYGGIIFDIINTCQE